MATRYKITSQKDWDTDGTLTANSDTKIASQKAVKTYVDNYVYSFIQRQAIINGGMEISQEDVAATKALANNTAKYACDLFSIKPSGTAVSAGTQAQISNSIIGTTGYALKIAGATITGSGTIKQKYIIESADAKKYKNKVASFGMLQLQDTGGSLNYTIQVNKADVADVFTAVTQIAISGSLAVPSAIGTRIILENVSMGDCSNGIEIVVTIPCGAITTKNFETTEWQMNVGAVALPFVCGSRAEELAKILRYYETSASIQFSTIVSGNVTATSAYYGSVKYTTQKRITPTLVVTNVDRVGFPATNPITDVTNLYGFRCYLTSNLTGMGMLSVTYIADARFTA